MFVLITHYTSPNYTDRPQVNIHCIDKFFTVYDFWATCACPEKNRIPLKFSLLWICFLHSGFLTTCACLENRVSPEIFHCIEYIFYYSGFLSNLRLSWKTRGCPEITVLNLSFLSLRIFEQLALALINRVCPDFTVLNMYFFSGFLSNLRLPWKTELPWNFSVYWTIFLSSRIFEQLALALKTKFALKFFKPGGAAAPPTPASYAYNFYSATEVDCKPLASTQLNCLISEIPVGLQLRSLLVHQKLWHWRPDVAQQHSFCYRTLGKHCHLGSNLPPYSKKTRLMHISKGLLDRTLRKNS